jgi:hypothetical protein
MEITELSHTIEWEGRRISVVQVRKLTVAEKYVAVMENPDDFELALTLIGHACGLPREAVDLLSGYDLNAISAIMGRQNLSPSAGRSALSAPRLN